MDAEIERLLARRGRALPPLGAYALRLSRFSPGDALAVCREPFTSLDFLLEGRARVFSVLPNGRATQHTVYDGVQVIGDLELLMDAPLLVTDVRALTACALVRVPLAGQREHLLSDAAMLRYLGRELALKLERSSRQGAENLLYPLSTRLAAYLLTENPQGETLSRLGERMGVSYRHLLRTLRAFCERGWIARGKSGYVILDQAALRREGRSMLDD